MIINEICLVLPFPVKKKVSVLGVQIKTKGKKKNNNKVLYAILQLFGPVIHFWSSSLLMRIVFFTVVFLR